MATATASQPADSFSVSAVGHQKESLKPTEPSYSFGLGTRDAREKLFISKDHEKLMPPRCSPGPVYRLESQSDDHSYTFGTAPQRPSPGKRYPDASIDLTNALVDSQAFKYPAVKGTVFGTDPKGQIKNATIMKNHAPAFYGKASPGPTAYNPDSRHTSRIPRVPQITLGSKTKILASECQTPPVVGPGTYPLPPSVGTQYLSQRRNLSTYSFTKARRVAERNQRIPVPATGKGDLTTRSVVSSIGPQHESRNSNAPTFGFGTATRDQKSKTFLVQTPGDTGPSGSWAKPRWVLMALAFFSKCVQSLKGPMAARAPSPNPLLYDDNYDVDLPPTIKGKVKILRVIMGICAFVMLACVIGRLYTRQVWAGLVLCVLGSYAAYLAGPECKMHISHCAMYAVFAGLNAFFDFIELLLRAIGTDRRPSRLFAIGVETITVETHDGRSIEYPAFIYNLASGVLILSVVFMGISFITAVLAYRVQSDYFFEQFVPSYAVSVEHRVSQRLSAASRSGMNDYGAVGHDGRRETFRAFSGSSHRLKDDSD
ncbi:hypothetical protein FOZ63_030019 [Perkinsus olseni]|uniref:Uncharacterized protein n=1 Tax=Perkinsus olseni TaxID=32597 RepID=A0A7J6S4H7_PEROL|nr:hypothetical protein FOZ63_030019 [Perkinsus olseni]KAF4727412.1 hypothetical protein FOZ62_011201 [Perkinsus olseni]